MCVGLNEPVPYAGHYSENKVAGSKSERENNEKPESLAIRIDETDYFLAAGHTLPVGSFPAAGL